MGASDYSHAEYKERVTTRSMTGTPVFTHDADVKAGKTKTNVHEKMDPKGVTRESRDSANHPLSMPIGVIMDVTGSMSRVPYILEGNLSKLMGTFLSDKASGKKYLGEYYPAILMGAVDDFNAISNNFRSPKGTLQVGQFESGIEIDNDLERIWISHLGGGTYDESYELALYFFARHTVTDHWEKRRKKGYLFLIGDEHAYEEVNAQQVNEIFGDSIQSNIPLEEILSEVKQRYNVFFIIPALTSHYGDESLRKYWEGLVGQQNVILLEDPEKVCETIAAAIAIRENYVNSGDLAADNVSPDVIQSLVRLSDVSGLPTSELGVNLTISNNTGDITVL